MSGSFQGPEADETARCGTSRPSILTAAAATGPAYYNHADPQSTQSGGPAPGRGAGPCPSGLGRIARRMPGAMPGGAAPGQGHGLHTHLGCRAERQQALARRGAAGECVGGACCRHGVFGGGALDGRPPAPCPWASTAGEHYPHITGAIRPAGSPRAALTLPTDAVALSGQPLTALAHAHRPLCRSPSPPWCPPARPCWPGCAACRCGTSSFATRPPGRRRAARWPARATQPRSSATAPPSPPCWPPWTLSSARLPACSERAVQQGGGAGGGGGGRARGALHTAQNQQHITTRFLHPQLPAP